jgi:hypothetical protein
MSDQKRELLVILNEECLEVGICVTKFLRFGEDSTFLKDNPLEQEVGDILAILELLHKAGNLDMDLVLKYRDAKLERLANPDTTNLKYPIKQVQGMDEDRIVRNLKQFFEEYPELDQSEFQINTSGAMVLRGLKDTANDIDLQCTRRQATLLTQAGYTFVFNDTYNCWICKFPDLRVDVHLINMRSFNLEGDTLAQFEGLKYQSMEDVLKLKLSLNRPKDQEDIKSLHAFLGV